MNAAIRSRDELVVQLRALLREAFRVRFEGGLHARAAHAQGLVDGYMRGLLDGGALTQAEVLGIVREERCQADGPAIQVLTASAA